MDRQPPLIFQYRNPRQFLLDTLAFRQSRDPKFSARSWAREMDISPSLLVMLMKGERPIRLRHVEFLKKGLSLSSQENFYFRALLQYSNADSPEEKHLCEVWLSQLNPGENFRVREVEEHTVLSQWIHLALIGLTYIDSFDGTAESAYELLGKKSTLPEIRSALIRLEDLGLIRKNENTGRLEASHTSISTQNDVTRNATHTYYRDMLRHGEQAITGQTLEEREFQCFSLAVHHSKIPLAKELIRHFRTQFVKAVGAREGADQLYHMNLQFFRLTESPTQTHRVEDEGARTTDSWPRSETIQVMLENFSQKDS